MFNLSVGSCNGTFHDTISAYMCNYKWRGMFVEPIPDAFAELKKYVERDLPEGCVLENVACSDTNVQKSCVIFHGVKLNKMDCMKLL